MRKRPGLSLIERALIAKTWHATAVDAQLHALIGDDSDAMVNAAGRILFVILGAAITEGMDADDPDLRIVRGAVNAVHDQAGEPISPTSAGRASSAASRRQPGWSPCCARKASSLRRWTSSPSCASSTSTSATSWR